MRYLLALLMLGCTSLGYALPVGNPADASLYTTGVFCPGNDCCNPCTSWCDSWSIRVGFYGDYVYDRKMEIQNGDHEDIDHTYVTTNASYLAFNLCDRVDIFATLGASQFYLKTPSGTFNGDLFHYIEIWSQTEFSWSVGARGTLWSCGGFYLGLEGQYFTFHPDVSAVYVPGNLIQRVDDTIDMRYREWQIGLGVSYLYQCCCARVGVVPYAALTWSRAWVDWEGNIPTVQANPITTIILRDLETQRYFGYALGITVVFCDAIGLTLEGRFSDTLALHFNAQFRF